MSGRALFPLFLFTVSARWGGAYLIFKMDQQNQINEKYAENPEVYFNLISTLADLADSGFSQTSLENILTMLRTAEEKYSLNTDFPL